MSEAPLRRSSSRRRWPPLPVRGVLALPLVAVACVPWPENAETPAAPRAPEATSNVGLPSPSVDAAGRPSLFHVEQGLVASFASPTEVRITNHGGTSPGPRAHAGTGSVVLRTIGWGRTGSMRAPEAGPDRMGPCSHAAPHQPREPPSTCVERGDGPFVEWWRVHKDGLEQGWTLSTPPAGEGPLHIDIESDAVVAQGTASPDTISLLAGRARFRYGGLHAWDAGGADLTASLTADGGAIRITVDDRGARWPIVVDPLLTVEAWSAEGNQNGAAFGSSVAPAGDVNGDGFGDVIVGARLFGNGEPGEGQASLFLGSASGLATTAAWTAEANQGGARLGSSVASAGDLNGDGYADVAVGAPFWDESQPDFGKGWVFLGSAGGLSTVAAWTVVGAHGDARLGSAVASAGDVNADGFSDLLIGSEGHDSPENYEGRAFLYLGGATGLAATAQWSTESDEIGGGLGSSLAGLGDVNGDGYGDVAIGVPGFSNGESSEGQAWLFLGTAGGLQPTRAWSGEPNTSWASMAQGGSLAGAGDVNGDGLGDILVGARTFSGFYNGEGRAFLYYGAAAGPTLAASWTVDGGEPDAELGRVAGAGDVNGDGFADILVGASMHDYGSELDVGRASLFLGSPAGPVMAPTWWIGWGTHAQAHFGEAVSSAGDVNGDGFADVVVAAPNHTNGSGQPGEGRVALYYGSPALPATAPDQVVGSGQGGAVGGAKLASVGDVDGDGYGDAALAAPKYDDPEADEGRVVLRLGSATGLASSDAWSFEPDQAGAELGRGLARAGDLNGDGYAEVAVGAPYFSNGETGEGRIWVFEGSAAGLSATAAWTGEPDQAGAGFGLSIAGAGDTNADGFDDLLVGSPWFGNGQYQEGAAFLYFGGAGGLGSSHAWLVEGEQASALFGHAVAGAGDVDADGYDDVLVGAPLLNNGASNEGVAFLYLSGPAGPSTVANWTSEGGVADSFEGTSVASAGDFNADGFADVLIGANGYDGTMQDEGRVQLFLGGASGPDAAPLITVFGGQAGAQLGIHVAGAGDLDADGDAEFVAGAETHDTSAQTDAGRAIVILGDPAAATSIVAWSATGGTAFDHLGSALAGPLDANGDGLSDLLIGADDYTDQISNEGAALLFLGGGGDFVTPRGGSPRLRLRQVGTATSIAPGGYTANPGFDVTIFSRAAAGGGRVGLEVEVKPVGVPFDGTGLVGTTELFDSGPNGGNTTVTVSGLAEDTSFHVRGRMRHSPASAPQPSWGPWMAAGLPGGATARHVRVPCLSDLDLDLSPNCTDPDDDGDLDPDAADCAPLDASIHHTAPEVADDGIDQDCSGSDTATCVEDGDGDGFGGPSTLLAADGDCADAGESSASDDCDDGADFRFPANPEVCDGVDNDCDGVVPFDESDLDNDAYAACDPYLDRGAINAELELIVGGLDCVDGDATIWPGAPESCDPWDSDCDLSVVDEDLDFDLDLEPDCTDPDDDGGLADDVVDCAPLDPSVNAAAAEIIDDGIDQDCSGDDAATCSEDTDGDGFGGPGTLVSPDSDCLDAGESDTSDDCDDSTALVAPGEPESCDAIDSDCDGDFVEGAPDTDGDLEPDCVDDDDDGDGSEDAVDCDDTHDTAFPGGIEEGDPACTDGFDNDCDETIDTLDEGCQPPGNDDSGDDDSGDDDSGDDDSGDDDSGDDDSTPGDDDSTPTDDDTSDDDSTTSDDDTSDDDSTEPTPEPTAAPGDDRQITVGPGCLLDHAGGTEHGLAAAMLVIGLVLRRRGRMG